MRGLSAGSSITENSGYATTATAAAAAAASSPHIILETKGTLSYS
jgi:hypothetical protein